MSKIVAVYCRVSTKKQDVNSQVPDLERWVKTCDNEVRWYKDEFTGKTMDRPGWNALYRDLQIGSVATIAVWRLDRLGRTAKGLTSLFDELYRLGVGLVSLKDGLDLSTAAGRLMANVLASVAQFETEVRAERILAGQAAAREKGKTWGGSEKGTRRRVTEDQVSIVDTMLEQNRPITSIAKAVGLSRQTIYRIKGELGS